MLMIRPAFRSMKYGTTAVEVRKTDFVLTAKLRSQSSLVLFVKGKPGGDAMPALFTRMSILPRPSRVRSTIAFTSAELVTSVFSANALRPSALTSSATFSALSAWMSGMATSAPSRAIARTMPRPMPLPPPVTIATLPASRMRFLRFSIIRASQEGPMTPRPLRSRNWVGRRGLGGFAHRSWLTTEGFSDPDHRPAVADVIAEPFGLQPRAMREPIEVAAAEPVAATERSWCHWALLRGPDYRESEEAHAARRQGGDRDGWRKRHRARHRPRDGARRRRRRHSRHPGAQRREGGRGGQGAGAQGVRAEDRRDQLRRREGDGGSHARGPG